jgi:5,6-dimethylbenzimidazole synthase
VDEEDWRTNFLEVAMTEFSESERAVIYRAIFSRRDIRRFRSDSLSEAILWRLLQAAHHAPSVGFMQPWNFIVIREARVKAQVKALFERERQAASCFYDEPERSRYLSFKLEGIMESPVNLCVTCDPTRAGIVLGRNSQPETDIYSTCCAIQNLWLAARAEGIGVGWVSILKIAQLRQILRIPPHVMPVAYLCIGYPQVFPDEPMLQTEHWRERLPLEELVFRESWSNQLESSAPGP